MFYLYIWKTYFILLTYNLIKTYGNRTLTIKNTILFIKDKQSMK